MRAHAQQNDANHAFLLGKESGSRWVPADAGGKSIHVVCEVTDDGVPALTGYRRVVVEVK